MYRQRSYRASDWTEMPEVGWSQPGTQRNPTLVGRMDRRQIKTNYRKWTLVTGNPRHLAQPLFRSLRVIDLYCIYHLFYQVHDGVNRNRTLKLHM
jgi:hypothetical protein